MGARDGDDDDDVKHNSQCLYMLTKYFIHTSSVLVTNLGGRRYHYYPLHIDEDTAPLKV